MATGTEETSQTTRVDHRWDSPKGRVDWETYDFIYTTAEAMRKSSAETSQAVGKLLLLLINEWEKLPRSMTEAVIQTAMETSSAFVREALEAQILP